MPLFDLTVVPVVAPDDPDSGTVEWARALGPEIHPLSHALPVGEMRVRVREPLVSSRPDGLGEWVELLREIQLARSLDGATGHYYGVTERARRYGIAGAAYQSDSFWFLPFAVGLADTGIMTHEFGHTMGLGHAPCGLIFNSGLDPGYPHEEGRIGALGYDPSADSLVAPSTYDLMSYCDPDWISAYSFGRALDYRMAKEGGQSLAAAGVSQAGTGARLLLWGGLDPEGALTLDPAFLLDMPARLPREAGPYRLEGFGGGGSAFSFDFAMNEVAHGGAGFLFAVPHEDGFDSLERIVLTGPEGTVELSGDSREPMALVLDRETGGLRSVLRGGDALSAAAAAAAEATGPGGASGGSRTLFSFGVPRGDPPE